MEGNCFTRTASAILILGLALMLVATSCTPEVDAEERTGVAVTILPLADFVENIGGEKVAVTVMVPSGASPHTYEPTPSQMVILSKAKMYAKVGSGIEFELVWMDKLVAANKKMLVIDCSTGVQPQEIAGEHRHEPGAIDPHIWMSPLNAKIMVQNICDGLVEVDPDNSAYYKQNRDIYLQKLAKLDQDIRNGLSGVANHTFMVYHPAFGYLAKDYNLTMLPVEEEGTEPTAAGLARLIKRAKEHHIKVVFPEPQFNPQSAKVIADAIDGKGVFINSLARDYIVNLRILLSELVQEME